MSRAARRLAVGLTAARKRSRQGAERFYQRFARRVGLCGMHEVPRLVNPLAKQLPPPAVRAAIEHETRAWPDPVKAREWGNR
jgi:hypothetical protein